jgi:hypothetical protein
MKFDGILLDLDNTVYDYKGYNRLLLLLAVAGCRAEQGLGRSRLSMLLAAVESIRACTDWLHPTVDCYIFKVLLRPLAVSLIY